MGARGKTVITLLLVGVVAGVLVMQTQNSGIFKGQIMLNKDAEVADTVVLPDLKPELTVLAPEAEGGDIQAMATIANIGEGAVDGTMSFSYKIEMNGVEIFSNSDTYSTLEPGDEFSFTYPISRSIYNYPDKGEAALDRKSVV